MTLNSDASLFIFFCFPTFVIWLCSLLLRGIRAPIVNFMPWPLSSMRGFMNSTKKYVRALGAQFSNPMGGAEGSEDLGKRGDQWMEMISWEPRAFVYHNFLSKEECEYIIKLSTPYMTKSTVFDRETGGTKYSSTRTSTGMSLKRGGDKIIKDIEKRIAEFTFIPVEHGVGLHVLHYEVGQKIDPHCDFLPQAIINAENGGQRIATVLMYLSDVKKGGETVFPEAKGKKGLSVKPKMGDALLFWSMKPDGTLDEASLHGGNPVIKGNKWSCTKWLHVKELKV